MSEKTKNYAKVLYSRRQRRVEASQQQPSSVNHEMISHVPKQPIRETVNTYQRHPNYNDENELPQYANNYVDQKRYRKPVNNLNNVNYVHMHQNKQMAPIESSEYDSSCYDASNNSSISKYENKPIEMINQINLPTSNELQHAPYPQRIDDFIDPQEFELLKEKNASLEAQLQKLQASMKINSDGVDYKSTIQSQAMQLEEAYKRIADLEIQLESKEKMIQCTTDAIAQFQSEINELTLKYKSQGNELLLAQSRNKDLELMLEDMKTTQETIHQRQLPSDQRKFQTDDNRIDDRQNRYYDEIPENSQHYKQKSHQYEIDYNNNDDQYYNHRRFNDPPIDNMNIASYNKPLNTSMYNNDQIDNYRNINDQPMYSRNEPGPRFRQNRDDYTKSNDQGLIQRQAFGNNSQVENASNQRPVEIHAAMRDNLKFGDDTSERRDYFDHNIVRNLRDDEIQNQLDAFLNEKQEKERKLCRAPEKGISTNRARIMKEQLEDEIEDLTKKISIVKREMKQRGLYC
ncbi:hypothetical protein TRFO_05255 [Tritrichomonas foetus]|uniref:Enkurin domain-containing protein n=1 Tax=Tritrichomonas foetus TaxID=1144522 RepID=A0A1J4K9H4_9EUKA|nr:hypothetical protein TRFO_05255 [Tritrichomonas foetus]|eukprot:OHT07594.1 hypothetical protein TRFO_05255 [Tritrichomonas foetus]